MHYNFTQCSSLGRILRQKGRRVAVGAFLLGALAFSPKAMAQSGDAATIKLSRTEVNLDLTTQFVKVTATVPEGQDIPVWASEDPSVAVVDETTGVIRAIGSGTTTITAANADGEASVKVTVADGFVSILPTDDAFINGGSNATKNYGSESTLLIKADTYAGTHRRSFIKFNLSDLTLPSKYKAQLVLVQTNANTEAAKVNTEIHAVNDTTEKANWTESTLTWNNQPTYSSTVLASLAAHQPVGATADENVLAFDLTSYIQQLQAEGKTVLDLAIVQSGRGPSGKNDYRTGSKNNSNELLWPRFVVYDNSMKAYNGITTTDVKLSRESMYAKMAVSIEPASAASDVKWSTSDNSIISVTADGNVLAKAPGEAKVFVTLPNGQLDSTTVTVADDVHRYEILGDTYVQDGSTYGDRNFGGNNSMIVKYDGVGYDRKAFVKFPLPTTEGTGIDMTNARPRIELVFTTTGTNLSTNLVKVGAYPAGDFDEMTLTSNTRPEVAAEPIAVVDGPNVISDGTSISERTLRFDVTDYAAELYAKGQDYISLMIYQTEKGNGKHDFLLATKENGTELLRPYLLLSAEDTTHFAGMSESELTLTLDKPYAQLTDATLPAGLPVTWTSSNPEAVYVAGNGQIIATGKGSATVYVAMANGKKDSCLVTVENGLQVTKAIDDAWVNGGTRSTNNYKNATTLTIKNEKDETYARKALLKFSLPSLEGEDLSTKNVKAVLLMNATFLNYKEGDVEGNSDVTFTVQPLQSSEWDNATVTWANAPAADATIIGEAPRPAMLGATVLDNYIAVDVTGYITSLYDKNLTPGELSLQVYQNKVGNSKHDAQVASIRNNNPMLHPRLLLLPADAEVDAYTPYATSDMRSAESGDTVTYNVPVTDAAYVTYVARATKDITYTVNGKEITAKEGDVSTGRIAVESNDSVVSFVAPKGGLEVSATLYKKATEANLSSAQYILVNGKLGTKETAVLDKALAGNTALKSLDLNEAETTATTALTVKNADCVVYDNKGTFNVSGNVVKNGIAEQFTVENLDSFSPLYPFTAKNISYTKTFTTGEPSLVVLPFTVDSTKVQAGVYGDLTFSAADVEIQAVKSADIKAGVPTFVVPTAEAPFASMENVNALVFPVSGTNLIGDDMTLTSGIYTKSPEDTVKPYVFAAEGENGIFSALTEEKVTGIYLLVDVAFNDPEISVVFKNSSTPVGIDKTLTGSDKEVNVYTIDGVLVKKNVKASQALEGLQKGIYIVGAEKKLVR